MSVIIAKQRLDESVTEDVRTIAIDRGRYRRDSRLKATCVEYLPSSESLLIHLTEEGGFLVPIKIDPELSRLDQSERAQLILGFGGYALCLKDRDLHVSITGLVSACAPIIEFVADVIAVRNGRQLSDSEGVAAPANGLKGRRQPKQALEE